MKRTPVRLTCPIACLGLPETVMAPLRRTDAFESPQTVGDLLKLARESRLDEIRNIGAGRIKEIEESLRRAGFSVRHHHHTNPDHRHDH